MQLHELFTGIDEVAGPIEVIRPTPVSVEH